MEKPGIVSVTLADIYFQQGYIEQSMEMYKELMKKEPYNDVYRKRLSAMKKDLKAKQKASFFKNR
jgi:hypothetical protein